MTIDELRTQALQLPASECKLLALGLLGSLTN